MSDVEAFFSLTEENQIVAAIKSAEKNTSGEIRVHMEAGTDEVMKRAQQVFEELEMSETELKNGVLFYLGTETKQFAILGDQGIDEVVPEHFWDSTKDHVINAFKEGEFTQGLILGIEEAGEQLKRYFPYQSDDVNELSDEISKG